MDVPGKLLACGVCVRLCLEFASASDSQLIREESLDLISIQLAKRAKDFVSIGRESVPGSEVLQSLAKRKYSIEKPRYVTAVLTQHNLNTELAFSSQR